MIIIAESGRVVIDRWWADLDVSTFVDFAEEEGDENENLVLSRTHRVTNSVKVAVVEQWGEIALD